MKLHKEGIKIIIGVFGIVLLLNFLIARNFPLFFYLLTVLASFIFFFLVIYFFRVPNRTPKSTTNGILSPCDGKIVVIEEVTENEYIQGKCIQISIFMSPLNVHINWYPISGKVLSSKHKSGKFYKAWLPKASTDNEQSEVFIEREDGRKILVKQIAGALARRIVTYAKKDDKAIQGNEFGFIKFGSRIDLFLPLDSKIQVKKGDKVKGLLNLIATIE